MRPKSNFVATFSGALLTFLFLACVTWLQAYRLSGDVYAIHPGDKREWRAKERGGKHGGARGGLLPGTPMLWAGVLCMWCSIIAGW